MDAYQHRTILACTFGCSLLIAVIGLGLKSTNNEHKLAHHLSLHAYQSNAGGDISFAGPFLGKIRVTKNATAHTLTNDVKLKSFQASCIGISDVEVLGKCKIMRTAPMYLGKIHSSWSVLGAQSITTLVKHSFMILLVFAIFLMSELLMRQGWWKDTHRPVRLVVVGLSVLLFVLCLMWDSLDGNMKSREAVGSVTTCVSVWLVCLLVICFSQVDDVVVVQTGNDENNVFDYKRFEAHMLLNVNMSFLILLLSPLFVLLSLTSFGRPVVDVHVQVVFFSYVFFAVLDVLQIRVVSVLASLSSSTNNFTGWTIPKGIDLIKVFVMIAFVLCKCFVFFPTWQLMGRYYVKEVVGSVPGGLHIFEIILVAGLVLVDLAYSVLGVGVMHFTQIHASVRAFLLCIYLIGSFICLACALPVEHVQI